MRGVVSAAMVCAIDQLDLVDTIDVIYGSSAGAINGAFLIARQTQWGIRLYYEEINNNHFINPWRQIPYALGLSRKPLADVSFPVQHLLLRKGRLDFNKVLHSPVPLKILASSVDRGVATILEKFQTPEELALALQASSTIPVFAGKPVQFRGDRYLDASLFERIPLDPAIADGVSHALVLLTRPEGDAVSKGSGIEGRLTLPGLRRLSPNLAAAYEDSYGRYARVLHRVQALKSDPHGSPRLDSIAPPTGTCRIGKLEKSRTRLLAAAKDAYASALSAFGLRESLVVEVLQGYGLFGEECSIKGVGGDDGRKDQE